MLKKHFICIHILLLTLFSTALFINSSCAEEIMGNTSKFKEYNPDWKKYEFTRDYISSLNYIYKNNIRFDEVSYLAFTDSKEIKRIAILRDDLIRSNVNLRVARNYLKKYRNQLKNGLMLKVSDMYTRACNDLIDLNNKERDLLEEMYYTLLKDEMDQYNTDIFEKKQQTIALKRKEALRTMVEASVWVTKILVSNKENYYGEFDRLGITQSQRYKLLNRIDQFGVESGQQKLESGQSFLQSSVVVIREILENYDYETTDG